MKDAWRELKRREEQCEEAPLARKPSSAGGARAKKKDEADFWDTGFTIREISQRAVRVWLLLQAIGLFFQVLLWNEVSVHLADYEVVVATQCAHEHVKHGVCTGPMWNLSMYQEAVLPTDRWSSVTTMNFATLSSPPTFLVAVDPIERLPEDKKQAQASSSTPSLLHRGVGDGESLRDAKWTLEVRRIQPMQTGEHFHKRLMGREAFTIEDLSEEAKAELSLHGRVEWRASLTQRDRGRGKTRYALFVEDAATPHLAEIHASTQCAFSRSWKAFNEQQQGRRHRVLAWCRLLLGLFLLVGGTAIWLVHREIRQPTSADGGMASPRFHALVFTKFLVHDVPQQVCIMLYALGWYEASGLRCQLCLFNPTHCVYESPFHFVNMTALGLVLLSSVSNQLLIRPVYRKRYTEDDICCHYTIRITGVCLSILPLSTGVLFGSHAILPLPVFFHVLFAVPCAIGWFSCMGLVCLPLLACCEEEDF